jgi:hypothetical protein
MEAARFSGFLAPTNQFTWRLKPKNTIRIATAVKNLNLTKQAKFFIYAYGIIS